MNDSDPMLDIDTRRRGEIKRQLGNRAVYAWLALFALMFLYYMTGRPVIDSVLTNLGVPIPWQ